MTDTPIFSRRQVQAYTPPDSPRSYTIAPLTYLERQAMRADLVRLAGSNPSREELLAAIRAAIREMQPGNTAELLAIVDAAEEMPEDRDAQARLAAVEAACATVPVYAELRAAGERFFGTMPYVAARHALRGWEGPELPPFRRIAGTVPEAVLDDIPIGDITAVGWAAWRLQAPGASAVGNSAPPSPSPETPETSPGG